MGQRHQRNSVSFVVSWLLGTFQRPAIFGRYGSSDPADQQYLWAPSLAAPVPPPAGSEHICPHVAPIGLSQQSEVQEDAIAQWRSLGYSAPVHLTPPGPMPPGFPPDSVPRAIGWPLSNSSQYGTDLRTGSPGERQVLRLSHIPLHDLDLPRKYLAVGASRRLQFPLLDQGEDLLPYGFPNSQGSCRTDSRVETRNRRCPKRGLIRSKPLTEPECGAGSFGQRSVSLNGQRAWHHLCHRWRVRRR